MKESIADKLKIFYRKYRWATYIFVISWAGLLLAFGYLILFSALPTFDQLENPRANEASIIYDIHGKSFGRYYVEDRVPIAFDELSPHIIHATVSTEDARFFFHNGVDIRAIFRVGLKTVLLRQKNAGGGSTLSQQLAKILYKRPSLQGKNAVSKMFNLIGIKLKEWITAVRLEKNYTKEEILAMYLNQFEFINGAHGIHSAALVYFGKDQKELNIEEAATLVGMLKNPSFYNPNRFPARCQERRNVVLALLTSDGYITSQTRDSLQSLPLDMSHFKTNTQSDGPAPYFRSELTKFVKKVLDDKGIKKSDGSPYNLYTDGLKIYTTIDLNYQKYAESALLQHMKKNQRRMSRTWKYLDPWSYDAGDHIKKIRLQILESKNKGSDRYQQLKKTFLDKILTKCSNQFPELALTDHALDALDTLVSGNKKIKNISFFSTLNQKTRSQFEAFSKTPCCKDLMDSYKKLQEKYRIEFSTPVRMKVFDYNPTWEKDTVMSPFDSVRYHSLFMQSGLVAIDPVTGHIKAWVGGINHKYFKFDHATMRRAVGSTIKPFVYTQAMAVQGISPCQTFDDIQYTISPGDANFEVNKEWSPANANELFTGNKYNLFHGLLYSKNSITVKLVKEMGTVAPIRDLLHNMGIPKDTRLENGSLAVPNLPSICLGAVDLTPLEITGAYTAFANNGTYSKPIFVTSIEDKNGKVIFTGISEKKPAINPLYNAVMVEMLKNNVSNRFAMPVKSQVGGKTGTTNDYTDAWFMGITPTLVIGIWTGADDKWIRFLSLNDGEGYTNARPIAVKFLQNLENDPGGIYDFKARFPTPPEGFKEIIDCEKYKQISVESERHTLLKEKLKNEEFDDEF